MPRPGAVAPMPVAELRGEAQPRSRCPGSRSRAHGHATPWLRCCFLQLTFLGPSPSWRRRPGLGQHAGPQESRRCRRLPGRRGAVGQSPTADDGGAGRRPVSGLRRAARRAPGADQFQAERRREPSAGEDGRGMRLGTPGAARRVNSHHLLNPATAAPEKGESRCAAYAAAFASRIVC